MPASGTLGDDAIDFQFNFLKSGGLPLVLGMLTRNNFLPNAGMETRRGAYLNTLKIAKLMLTAIGFGHVKAVAEACQPVVEGTNPASPVRLSSSPTLPHWLTFFPHGDVTLCLSSRLTRRLTIRLWCYRTLSRAFLIPPPNACYATWPSDWPSRSLMRFLILSALKLQYEVL